MYGPETGYVSLATESQTIELITYDENSYYRRVGFRSVDLLTKKVVIKCENKTRDIKLVRSTSLVAMSRREFICGLLLESNY